VQRLTPDLVETFLSRFYRFYDGVVERAALEYVNSRLQATLELEVMDGQAESGWCTLTLRCEDVTLFHVDEEQASNVIVAVSGVHVFFADDQVHMDFQPLSSEYELAFFSQSTFVVRAHRVWFHTAPCKEK